MKPGDVDARAYPTVEFGSRATMWWGSVGFLTIEAVTLAVCLSAYAYLWRNFPVWPPPRTPSPALGVSTLSVIVVLASLVPAEYAKRAALRLDERATTRGLLGHSLFGLALLVLRGVELTQLGTKWDEHAYGSIVWMTMGLHAAVVLTDVVDTWFVTWLFVRKEASETHYSGVVDNDVYWNFVVVSWLAVYAVIFLAPRFTR